MPQFNFPSDSIQRKIIKAFKKLGFIKLPLGKGSHQVMEDPKTKIRVTIQHKIYKNVIREYCKIIIMLNYDIDKFINKL
ncbi:MAG: type II toxin-antitoxin system HicA family toxin [Patescibacteria group bacterium]|nr:type II toxin-antitoxin system HicA family toxin [Patescibacteria group bacterium]